MYRNPFRLIREIRAAPDLPEVGRVADYDVVAQIRFGQPQRATCAA